jgi:large subunit ribosomal protein L20
MPRVTRGTKGHRRHKKILSLAKGYVGGRSLYRQGRETVEKGLTYAYRDRKVRKREFRALWIVRINAAARESGLSYSRFMDGLNKAGVTLDRKVLADIAVFDKPAFAALAHKAKAAL